MIADKYASIWINIFYFNVSTFGVMVYRINQSPEYWRELIERALDRMFNGQRSIDKNTKPGESLNCDPV